MKPWSTRQEPCFARKRSLIGLACILAFAIGFTASRAESSEAAPCGEGDNVCLVQTENCSGGCQQVGCVTTSCPTMGPPAPGERCWICVGG